MYQVGDFYRAIDGLAPFSTAEQWDNVGLMVGGMSFPVNRVLLALDLTGPVLDEAVSLSADLVITHHPFIFQPLKRLHAQSLPYRAVRARISVLSAHTNLDLAVGGVNDALADRLGLAELSPLKPGDAQPYYKVVVFVPVADAERVYLAMSEAGAGQIGDYSHCAFLTRGGGRFLPGQGASPAIGQVGKLEHVEEIRVEMICGPGELEAVLSAMKRAHPYEEAAYDVFEDFGAVKRLSLGRVGTIQSAMPPEAFAAFVKERLCATGLRYVPGASDIKRVAVCGGSGGDLAALAAAKGAQALVTADVKHNQLLEAGELGLTVIDGGHFATENVVMAPLRNRLSTLLPDVEMRLSAVCTDGTRYL